jgi:hypothetical protein
MSSGKRKAAVAASNPIFLDLTALRTFVYEKDLYRNGRYSTNALFNEILGPNGSEFDFAIRNTFQFFVRKHLQFNPTEVLDCQVSYMISNKVMNAAFANTYFGITWKTQRVEHVLCRTNVLAAISHYRTDFWKFLKSIVLRPCHMDTNLAMSHYWGSRTTESTPGFVYRFGLESVDDSIFYSFNHDVDDQSLVTQCNTTCMGIPDIHHYDPSTKTFSDEMSLNIFEHFIELVDSTIRYAEECISDLLEFVEDEKHQETALISRLNEISAKILSWKAQFFQLENTVFTIAHECIEICKRYHHYSRVAGEADAPDPVTPATPVDSQPPPPPTKVPDFEMCYLAMKHHRILNEAVLNLRSSHVWLFFAYGRSADSDEWVLNPCGRWNTHHFTLDDFIKSETAEFWFHRVNTNSMLFFAKLAWMIMFKHAPEISSKTSLAKDAAYFEAVRLQNQKSCIKT